MTASWKSWPNLIFISLSLCATGAAQQEFQLEPLNLTVLQGSDARFNATVQGTWDLMTWHIGEFLVLSFRGPETSDGSSTSQYSARFCSTGDPGCVEFTIHNVSRSQSGEVTCSVLGSYGSKTAHLIVQEKGTVSITGGNMTVGQDQQVEFQCATFAWYPTPTIGWTLYGEAVNSSLYNTTSVTDGVSSSFNSTSVLNFQAVRNTTVECWATVSTLNIPESSSVFLVVVPTPPDWTVLIAVVVSIGGFALLVLLILGIFFCYKRRKEKESNYQDEMSRRVRTQSEIRQGQVNAGYELDGQTSVAPSEHSDSGFSQANGSSVYEIPDVRTNQAENGYKSAYNTVDDSGLRKHRHVTIV